MTTKQLCDKIELGVCLGGHFKVTINHANRYYHCTSTNTSAYDRIKGSDDINSDKQCFYGYTLRQALQSLWDECKRKNF